MIKKVIIPAAGLGTRFLPITKSQPKEMLPLLNKPLIQYSVEEAFACGVELVVIVTALGKIGTRDATKLLLEVLKADDTEISDTAKQMLKSMDWKPENEIRK
jgi:UTP--glucose-1-phosphate uridylyltransferase